MRAAPRLAAWNSSQPWSMTRSGLAVVAGPSAEAGADPCRIGERAPGVGVALSFGPAFEAFAQGFEEGQVVRVEGVGDGAEAALGGGAGAGRGRAGGWWRRRPRAPWGGSAG